ncbi:MAG: Do family serine endopeptidase [Armatimonadota bacterium]
MLSYLRSRVKNPSLLMVCILSLALGFSLASHYYQHVSSPAIAAPPKDLSNANWRTAFADIADKIAPSVVFITSEKDVTYQSIDPFEGFGFGWPFGEPRQAPKTEKRTQKATGSGFVVRSDGYILTNNHVVAGADRVTVKLSDGRDFKGKVFLDPRTDLALVKIEATNLPAVTFADSDKVQVGEWAIAIGNPFGWRNTVTVGVVSALRRESDPSADNGGLGYPEAIQTDAAINPGNSGGPLVDVDGKVIGVNFMIISSTRQSAGIGFAIPSNSAKFVMDQLITKGKVVRGYLGLVPVDLSPVKAEVYGTKKGALVESVEADSPADKAGIQVADIITQIDGKTVDTALDLRRVTQSLAPGSTIKLTVLRDKAEKVLTVKLGEAPSGLEEAKAETGGKLGLSVDALTQQKARSLGLPGTSGVVVTNVEPGSAADRAGIQKDDVISRIDNTVVKNVATYNAAIAKLKNAAVMVIHRGGTTSIIEVPLD